MNAPNYVVNVLYYHLGKSGFLKSIFCLSKGTGFERHYFLDHIIGKKGEM